MSLTLCARDPCSLILIDREERRVVAIGGLSMGRWESGYHCFLDTERLLHAMRRLLRVGDGDVCI